MMGIKKAADEGGLFLLSLENQCGREPPDVLPLLDELAEEPWEAELALALAALRSERPSKSCGPGLRLGARRDSRCAMRSSRLELHRGLRLR